MKKPSRFAYWLMMLTIKIRDAIAAQDALLDELGIEQGFTVADIGCGPGGYIRRASRLVGESGRVYAIDVHEMAIKAVKKKIKKEGLKNVIPVLNDDGLKKIAENSVDMAYALDMFHMVEDAEAFLHQIHRIIKEAGWLILEDGHQSRQATKAKLRISQLWEIVSENERYVKLIPKQKV